MHDKMTPTEKEIIGICDEIAQAKGLEAVTYRAVKEARGGRGSYSTIGQGINRWRVLRQLPGAGSDSGASDGGGSDQSASLQIENLKARCDELAKENENLKKQLSSIDEKAERIIKAQDQMLGFLEILSGQMTEKKGEN